jgi:hypothetical protein
VRGGQQDVVPGQRFRVAGGGSSIWEVIGVSDQPGEAVPHVRLARVGAPKDLKTVSALILRNRRFYEPVP